MILIEKRGCVNHMDVYRCCFEFCKGLVGELSLPVYYLMP